MRWARCWVRLKRREEEAARLGLDVPAAAAKPIPDSRSGPVSKSEANTAAARVQPTVRGLPVPANAAGASYMSPRMKARMDELGLHAADLAGVAGSGAAGRVTIQDFEKFLANLEKQQDEPGLAPCAWRWPTPCGAVGRGRWRRWLCRSASTPCWRIAKPAIPSPARRFTRLRALALALAENSAPAGRLVGNKIVHPLVH